MPKDTAVRNAALVHDLDADTYWYDLRYATVDGNEAHLLYDRGARHRTDDALRSLLRVGADLPADRKKAAALVASALSADPKQRYSVTSRTGWHGSSFVLPDQTYGPDVVRCRRSDDANAPLSATAGTLKTWKSQLAHSCEASSYVTFAIGAGLAGPVLGLVGEPEGVVFNLVGESSTGKTLAELVAQSVLGRAIKNELPTLAVTPRGLEELAFSRNDLTLIVDEFGRAAGSRGERRQRIRDIAYMLPGGTGKIRSRSVSRDGDLRNLSWRLIGMTSSEEPLDAMGARASGEQVRLIEIPVPRRSKGGIFDRLEDGGDAVELARAAEAAIARSYGVCVRDFLEEIVEDQEKWAKAAQAAIKSFVTKHVPHGTGWEVRFARKFGIVYAALKIAAKLKIVPFTSKHGHRCISGVYKRARKQAMPIEELAMTVISKVARNRNNEKRFPWVEKGDAFPAKQQASAWGFRRTVGGDMIVAIPLNHLDAISGVAGSAQAMIEELDRRGLVIRGSDGKRTRQLRVQGYRDSQRPRFVCLPEAALSD